MPWYHASSATFAVGDEIIPGHASARSLLRREADEILDRVRPASAPTRAEAVFIFDQLDHAVYFLQSEDKSMSIYEVTLEGQPWRAPMALAQMACKASTSQEKELIGKVYWDPQDRFAFYEYLARGATVAGVVNASTCKLTFISEVAILQKYNNDREQMRMILSST